MEFSAQMPILDAMGGLAVGFTAIVGAIVGSFFGTVAVRLPAGRSIAGGASACDHCGRRVRPWHLVPLVSWLALRGRCPDCGGRIGSGQLLAEAGGALVGGLAWLAPSGLELAAMALGWQLLLLALLDARCLWLPWRLTALVAATGLALAAMRDGWLVSAALGAALGYGMLALVALGYRRLRGREGMGGGDPLLLGAIGIWVGPQGVVMVMLVAALLGLGVAAIMAMRGGQVGAGSVLPLGTFMALAAWPVFLLG